jgi:DNA polymerase III sliding clamp (beta) subunit (PCNA family)
MASTPKEAETQKEDAVITQVKRKTDTEFTLSELAKKINAGHEACVELLKKSVVHALKNGRWLIQAKEQVPYGEWEDFKKSQLSFSARTAEEYMYIAKHGEEIEADPRRFADLTHGRVLKELRSQLPVQLANRGKINRSELLKRLEAVKPGVASREILEQTDCFIFKDGFVRTYNDEMSCTNSCDLGIEGAIKAEPLLRILRNLGNSGFEFKEDGGKLTFKTDRLRAEIPIDKEILLQLECVEEPGDWKPLHEDFNEAVRDVERFASREESNFELVCVHLHPNYIEACDRYQIARYPMKIGVEQSMLVRADSLKQIANHEMTEFSETDEWIHFKNGQGLVHSCRKYRYPYPDLSQYLKVEGTPLILPEGLKSAAKRAELISRTKVSVNHLLIELRKGKLQITGEGEDVVYKQRIDVEYEGENLEFRIFADALLELLTHAGERWLSDTGLITIGEKFQSAAVVERYPRETYQQKRRVRRKARA